MTGTAGPFLRDGWELAGLPHGAADHPDDLADAPCRWLPATVPGTVASALVAAGEPVDPDVLDGRDWWYRARIEGRRGPHRLELGGIATIADVWCNGRHLAHHENMHRRLRLAVELTGHDELVVRCGALAPVLARRRPRPRWKTYLVAHTQLRAVRTSLLGRIPGWASVPPAVGLWREVSLMPDGTGVPTTVRLTARCGGDGGEVGVCFMLTGVPDAASSLASAHLEVAGTTAPLTGADQTGVLVVSGTLALPSVERWWPHTHGPQPLYAVSAEIGGHRHHLGTVGFRTVSVDRSDGGFCLLVNGERVFCRGATWFPPDPVSLTTDEAHEAHLLDLAVEAGLNMLRLPGTAVYEQDRFFSACDARGICVWQDAMFAFMDPPTDDAFVAEATAEVTEAFGALGGHPSVAVLCGNQEVDEVAAMFGLAPEARATPLFDETFADLAAEVLPGVPYVTSNPTGGDVPFRMGEGVSQYFGVGGYLRPLDDARRAHVRFAAECLLLATPPEPDSVERCGGAWRAGHDAAWKQGVHHDAGRSWDMEDVRAHYVATLFGTDPLAERYRDAERALELGRAANARLVEAVFSEWRRPGSFCDGGLVVALGDLRPGAGWGLLDAFGRPKATWYALKRVCAPVALLAIDEGLDGLVLHVVNDTSDPLDAVLGVELVTGGSVVTDRGEVAVAVPPRGATSVGAEAVLGHWRDVTYAYRFAPPGHDACVATLRTPDAGPRVLSQVVHLPLGQARPVEADLGLVARAWPGAPGRYEVEVATERLAQWVAVRAPGYVATDSWFHLPPGHTRTLELWREPGARGEPPYGTVSALNAAASSPIRLLGR